MEKTINKLLVFTAVMAVIFMAGAYYYRNDDHDTAVSVDTNAAFCEYIDIDLLRLNVTVVPYDGEDIRISYKNELPLDISFGDNRLAIAESDKFVISLFAGSASDFGLYLYLPRSYYREITIYTGGGSVRVGGVDSELLTVITNSGDIYCDDSRSLSFLTTGTGNITLDCDTVVDKTTVQSRNGNAEIILPDGASAAVDFETITGELHTKLISGEVFGEGMYSFYGGGSLVHASLETGTLTIREKN